MIGIVQKILSNVLVLAFNSGSRKFNNDIESEEKGSEFLFIELNFSHQI